MSILGLPRLDGQHCASRMGSRATFCPRFLSPLAIVLLAASSASAQQAVEPPAPTSRASLTSEFFDHDYVNFYVFGDGLYDSNLPILLPSGSSGYGSSLGWDAGGGVNLTHSFKGGSLSFAYRGDYKHYESNTYSNGTDQNASLNLTKQLNRRWALTAYGSGGILQYGGTFYGAGSVNLGPTPTNPLSSQSRVANVGASISYAQTRRLSYVFSGSFFVNDYNYHGAITSVGGSGSVSLQYRLTARTTIGGTYTHSYFTYGQNSGNTNVDGGYFTLSHIFADHWTASVSLGLSHSHSQGVLTEPVSFILDGQVVTGYVVGPYNRSYNTPSVQASLVRYFRHSSFSLDGGQGVVPGNGTFLTSKDQDINGVYSISSRLSNISFGGGYYRLTSISNNVSQSYSSTNFSASYGYTLHRYLSAHLRYDFLHYGGLFGLAGLNESRISFGLSLSTKSVPLTLF